MQKKNLTEVNLKIQKRVEQIPEKDWAELWCLFNKTGFPEILNDVKPEWYGNVKIAGKDHMFKINITIMKFIENKIGIKECLRFWNKDKMTNDEFENWWTHEKD